MVALSGVMINIENIRMLTRFCMVFFFKTETVNLQQVYILEIPKWRLAQQLGVSL